MTIDSMTSFHPMYRPTALTRRPANRVSPLTHACHGVQRSSKTPLSQTTVANCIPNRDGNQTDLEVMRRLIELELCSIWSHSEKHLQTPKSTEPPRRCRFMFSSIMQSTYSPPAAALAPD